MLDSTNIKPVEIIRPFAYCNLFNYVEPLASMALQSFPLRLK